MGVARTIGRAVGTRTKSLHGPMGREGRRVGGERVWENNDGHLSAAEFHHLKTKIEEV